jgi:meiotically up-regulated gene 157 (Mug157) protein
MKRKEFIKLAATTVLAMGSGVSFSSNLFGDTYVSKRPPLSQRNFTSDSVEALIKEISAYIPNPELAWLFSNCFPNTLDTTVVHTLRNGKPDTFVITGDIHAMWLRDSSAQVWPYLPLAKNDRKLKLLIEGVIRRQTSCVLLDPYANAFNDGPGESMWTSDDTTMRPELHERKWEIDSLCYPVRLAYGYWKATGDASIFDSSWKSAASLIVKTFREQQRIAGPGPYRFQRRTKRWTDTLEFNGYGMPTRKVGLIHSMFRPSDDACLYPFLIPSNYFATTILGYIQEIALSELGDIELARSAGNLKDEVSEALSLYAFGVVNGKRILAYEVDGFGNQCFADDSNVPSLLSLPYLDALENTDIDYQATRGFVLSEKNPFYFSGKVADGVGGPHVGMDMVWPMAITMQALTSSDETEIQACIQKLMRTHAGTGFMHEAFHKDDPKNYTRPWFAWANTLFGELIVTQYKNNPSLLRSI